MVKELLCTLLVLTAGFCLATRANAKEIGAVLDTTGPMAVTQPKRIGEVYADIDLNNLIVPVGDKSIVLKSLKKKYLIIDFFATWCLPCVKALARLDSLSKDYSNDLQILLVTGESRAVINKFLQNNVVGRANHFPILVEDSTLQKVFPHVYIPHEVWLDRNRKVLAITSEKEITSNNFQDFVAGRKISLPEKKELTGFDPERPLFDQGNGGSPDDYLSRSILAKTDMGLSVGVQVKWEGKTRLNGFVAPISLRLLCFMLLTLRKRG